MHKFSFLDKYHEALRKMITNPETQKAVRTSTGTRILPGSDISDKRFLRLVNMMRRVFHAYQSTGKGAPFLFQWRENKPYRFGEGEPLFTIIIQDRRGVSAVATLDATTIFEAYMADHVDFRGDIEAFFSLRDMTTDKHPLQYLWSLAKPLFFGQTKMDRTGIAAHYDHPREFYESFLDRRHRCYSQGVYVRNDETLEDAVSRKLEFAVNAIGVKPGDRVLDIGGGWGAFTEYAGKKGIHVTSLTISKESEDFLNDLITKQHLPCDVVNCHLYEYAPGIQFDAIVNLGVTEHLPDYARSLKTYLRLMKPGAKIYLDASACREKYKFHSFIYKHIYPNNCSPLCLHDYLTQLANTPFRLLGIWDDRHSYYLTAKQWAINLENNREIIVKHGGEALFRKFQIYLWGTANVFQRDIMQAYRWVLEKP